MTDIEEKSLKAYPEQMMNYGPRVTYDRNHERREAYARGRKDERFETESLPSEKYWVAREKQGSLFLFKLKPRRHTNGPHGFWLGEPRFLMPEDMFPDITWESEPKEYKCLFREIRYESQSDNNG